MKKTTVFALMMTLVLAFSSVIAYANDNVSVTIESGSSSELPETTNPSKIQNELIRGTQRPSTTLDLATSSDKQSHQYGNLVYGNYLYSNHNGTIKATVWNENTFEQVFVLSLYDSSGNLVKKENLTIGGRVIGLFNYKSVTFSGLSTSKTYYYVLSQSTNTQYDQTIEIKR